MHVMYVCKELYTPHEASRETPRETPVTQMPLEKSTPLTQVTRRMLDTCIDERHLHETPTLTHSTISLDAL